MGSRGDQDTLSSYFDRSVYAVHQYADRLEHEYARPAIITSQDFFNAHPVSSTFIVIFCLLSLGPILFFVGFSVLATISIVFVALCFAFLAFGSVMIVSASTLVFILLVILLMTSFLTVFLVSAFLAGRLGYLLYTNGSGGVYHWFAEISARILSTKSRLVSLRNDYTARSDTSSDSAVMVHLAETKPLNNKGEDGVSKGSMDGFLKTEQ